MPGPRSSAVVHSPSGLTLVEVMLVLALIVVMGALAWPALERPISSHRLRRAADQVRTEWVRTRVEAMSTGQTYTFQCMAGTGEYVIQPQAGAEAASSEWFSDDLAAQSPASQAATRVEPKEGNLPEGITFYSGDTGRDALGAEAETSPVDSTLDSAAWSEPILFYPDGTTSTARLHLKNDYERVIELSLRGLTGTVTVSDVQSVEDIAW